MTTLEWTDTLVLDFPPMDDMHHEFVDLLAAAEASNDRELPQHWQALLERAKTLFDQEDAWMANTRFAPGNHHALHHRVVLNVMREGVGLARNGRMGELRKMVVELGHWYAKHIQSQDAALALHLRRHGISGPSSGPTH